MSFITVPPRWTRRQSLKSWTGEPGAINYLTRAGWYHAEEGIRRMQGLTLNAAISSPAITIEARVKTFFQDLHNCHQLRVWTTRGYINGGESLCVQIIHLLFVVLATAFDLWLKMLVTLRSFLGIPIPQHELFITVSLHSPSDLCLRFLQDLFQIRPTLEAN